MDIELQPLVTALINAVAMLLSALATWGVGELVRWLRRRGELEQLHIDAELERKLRRAAIDAVNYAEQWALKVAKRSAGQKPPSDEKLRTAIDHAWANGAAAAGRDRIAQRIEAELGRRNSLPPPPANRTNGISR